MAIVYRVIGQAEPGGWINMICPRCSDDWLVTAQSLKEPVKDGWERFAIHCGACQIKDAPRYRPQYGWLVVPAGIEIRHRDQEMTLPNYRPSVG